MKLLQGARRKAAGVLIGIILVAAAYFYWAWDPTDVMRYVPHSAEIVVLVDGLDIGLRNIRYDMIARRLTGQMKQTAELLAGRIAPGLTAMDIIGSRCVLFLPRGASDDLAGSAVLCARTSQRAKFAEAMAALIGKSQSVKTPGDRSVRMIRTNGYTVYYRYVDRILITSASLTSMDTALSTPPLPRLSEGNQTPFINVHISGDAIKPLLQGALGKKPAGFAGDILDKSSYISEVNLKISLAGALEFEGSISLHSGILAEQMYRADFEAFTPRTHEMVPAEISLSVTTNSPGLVEDLGISTAPVNTLLHAACDFFDDMKDFRGELTLAVTSPDSSCFLIVATGGLMFPKGMREDFLDKLRGRVGETDYLGEEVGGKVYRIAMPGGGPPAFLWLSSGTIVVCSSEGALDTFTGTRRAGNAPSPPRFGKGDFFIYANPGNDPGGFLRTISSATDNYLSFVKMTGPVTFEAIIREGRLVFSGKIELKP